MKRNDTQMNVAGIRRNIKNLAHNYSDAQIKVREATSNDPWGPSSTIMAEIADLTYNVVAFSEIMQMIWKRTNDHGKNWRHVYKALLLLEYLIKTGTEKVAQQCKENIYAIQTLKDFQYIEEGKDQGMHVREKAKQLVSLLKDDERLKNERARALKAKERFARTASGFGSDGSIDGPTTRDARPPNWGEGEPTGRPVSEIEFVRPQTVGEEELQLQLAMAMSREEAEQEEQKRRSDDVRLQLALSQSEQDFKHDDVKPANSALVDLLDISFGAASISSPSQQPGPSTSTDPWGLPVAGGSRPQTSDPWSRTSSPPVADPWLNSASALPPPASKPPQLAAAGVGLDAWAPARTHSPSVTSGSSVEGWLQNGTGAGAAAVAPAGTNGNIDPWLKSSAPSASDAWQPKRATPVPTADPWQPPSSNPAKQDPWAPLADGAFALPANRPSPVGAITSPASDLDEFDIITKRSNNSNAVNNNLHNNGGSLLDDLDPLSSSNTSSSVQPQIKLLRFVLEQPYSRDMVCSMLNLQKTQKQKCVALEEQLVWLVICAMECSEKEPVHSVDAEISSHTQWVWLHLSSQLIYFVLFQFATFQNIVNTLHDKLAVRNLRRGRDHLMWVLLQYISGSIQRNSITNFLPILKLYDILYPEKEPLPVPDYNNPLCTHQMAPTCIWIHLLKRAQSEHYNINRPIPTALKLHHEFLQHLVMPNNNATLCMGSDYRLALLCNAYSTNPDYFSRPMAALIETILGNSKNQSTPGAGQSLPTVPLSMCVLDSLTIHSKMSLIHSIVTHMIKQAQNKSTIPNANNMAPALVETYSRLLVYTEIESLGIKGFLSQLLPQVFKSHAWGILYTLLEMFSYRMHHIQPHYRVQLLSHLHSLASVPHTNQMQLHSCVESTALRLITGLGSVEVQAQLSRYVNEPKTPGNIVSAESEELNRALILTLARSMQITGTGNDPQSSTWCKDLLNSIMQNTPHTWSVHTLQCFPPVLNDFFLQHNVQKENKQLLKKSVDEEYRNWASMSNENDIIGHFGTAGTPGTPPLFLCLLFKMIVETDTISPVAYKILERIGARALSAHLRKLCDYLVFEVSNSGVSAHVNKCVDTINDMIWKYNIITIDRLVLCLSLRTLEGNEAQVSFCIIQLLLLKTSEFRNRLQEFVSINSPEHWKQNNWHERHLAFHQKFPEKFTPDESVSHPSLPVYFGNVCLRFLPVLDITIHRYLEVPAAMSKTLDVLLEHLGPLYKFHDRPITYLYNTLHYYERMLRERSALKKRLVGTVIGSLKDVRPDNWAVTEQYQSYMSKKDETVNWIPDLNYFIYLVRRMQDTIDGTNVFPGTDWRFNEFPNPPAHALYVTCVELLGLPMGPQAVANSLIDVVVKGYPVIPAQSVHSWINTIGLIMAALPESYWGVIYERLREVISCPQMVEWIHRQSPFELFNFKIVREAMLEKNYVVILAIAQSILHHSGIGQISTVTDFIKEKFKPIIKTEYQLIYLCHLVGPFLNRLSTERPRAVSDITLILYELLEQVDKAQASAPLKYMDPICDLLYHIKYMFIGDMMKSDLEAIIRRLRPALQMRLRFITRLNVDEIGVDQQNGDAAAGHNGTQQAQLQPQGAGQQGQPGQSAVSQQQPPQQVQQQQQQV